MKHGFLQNKNTKKGYNLNIAIDQNTMQKSNTMYQYISNIVSHLPVKNNQIFYYINSINTKNTMNLYNNVRDIKITNNSLMNLIYYYSIGSNIRQNKDNIDVYWEVNNVLPLFMSKYKVVTVKDLISIKNKNNKNTKYLKFMIKQSLKRQNIITTMSIQVKNDIIKIFNIDPNKIKIIYPQFDHINTNISKNQIQSFKNKYGIKNNYIFTLYPLTPIKNVLSIIKQYNKTNPHFQTEYSLIIGGNKSNEYNQYNIDIEKEISKNRQGKILRLNNIPQEELDVIYQGQSLFVSQVLDSGFDMPIIEQLKNNIPVVQSDIFVHKEMMGKLQLYFDPFNIDMLQGQIQYSATKSKSFYTPDTYLFKYRYTWDMVAKEYMKIFNNKI